MLGGLRGTRGEKTLRMRLLAALVVVAMLAAVAPLLFQVVRWLLDAVAYLLF